MSIFSKKLFTLFLLFTFFFYNSQNEADKTLQKPVKDLIVGYAGTEPFVINENDNWKGISVEIWDLVSQEIGIKYVPKPYASVSQALNDLSSGKIDVLVGPTSITSERSELVEFSQPYF